MRLKPNGIVRLTPHVPLRFTFSRFRIKRNLTMATNTGQIMTLANSIIGVSVLAMPFCFKQCGIILSVLMLVLSSIISRLSCHYVIKSSIMCRRRNFELLAFYSFGPSGKLFVELGVIGFMMGTCVAFFVVMGDLGPEIISKLLNINNSNMLRTSVLIGIGLFIVLPLGLLRNVESLAAVSTVTIGFYFLLVIKIFSESSSHLIAGDWMEQVNFWRPEGVVQCVPIFAMSLACQTQIFEIYDSLPNPSLDKINNVVRNAVNICTLVYISVGFLGYVAYCTASFEGNILLSFSPTFTSELCKLGFVLSIAVSFPLVIFPCRASLYSLLFRKVSIHHELSQPSTHIPDSRFKCLTLIIVAVSLIVGLLIPSIELVLGFVGSTIGLAICVIFPALVFIKMFNKDTNERHMAKVTLILGLVIMVTGTYGNLYAASEGRPIETVYEKPIPGNIPLPRKSELIVPEISKKEEVKPMQLIEENKPPNLLPEAPVDKIKQEPSPSPPPEKSAPNPPQEPPEKLPEKNVKAKEKPMDVAPLNVQQEESKDLKLQEPINKDAIEKEEQELKEAENQKKTEEDQKKQDLLKKLKDHEDQQKKLLQEQDRILKEMKDRDKEKKQEEVVVKEDVKKIENPIINEVKPIQSEEFKKNIDTIQNVIDGLMDKNQAIEKEKLEAKNKIENEAAAKAPIDKPPEIPAKIELNHEVKSKIPSVPLPIAMLQNNFDSKKLNKDEVKSKQEAMGRDILGSKNLKNILIREKRDAEPPGENTEKSVEECPRTTGGNVEIDKKEINMTSEKNASTESEIPKIQEENKNQIIKDSKYLSVPSADDTELKISGDAKSIPDKSHVSVIPKKRDLKFVKSRDD